MNGSPDRPTSRVATLGSPLTFAGQATEALRRARPAMGEPEFFPTMDEVAAAVLDGRVDYGVLTSETSHTACTETAARILTGEKLFVTDEILVPYRCALLGKPGSRLEDITQVGGHGSIRQCGAFLRERLPNADVQIHLQNSAVAAREVLESDGSRAVIATEAVATELGLEIIERNVDGGSVGGWWVLSATRETPAGADHLAVRVEGADELNAALDRVSELGLSVRTITNAPSGEIFEYRYLLVLRTIAGDALPASTVETFGPAVVGVFSTTSAS